jgi:hypothetical protein
MPASSKTSYVVRLEGNAITVGLPLPPNLSAFSLPSEQCIPMANYPQIHGPLQTLHLQQNLQDRWVGKRHACLEHAKQDHSQANREAAVEELYNLREFEGRLRRGEEGGFVWLAWADIPAQEKTYVGRLVEDFCSEMWAPAY